MPETITAPPPPKTAPTTAAKPSAPSAAPPIKPIPPAEVKPPPVKEAPKTKSFFEEIDELATKPASKPAAPQPPAPKKEGKESPPTSDAPDASKTSEAQDSATDKTGTTENASQGQQDKPPVKAAELRTAYENLKREHAALKAEREKEKTAKPAEDPEKKTLIERLDAEKKRADELAEKLKFTNWQESDEYKTKYHQPFIDAYTTGRNRAASLKVTDSEGNERPGTAADFDAIMAAPSDEQAAAMASDMFGVKASMVLYHRERVQEISNAAAKAQADFRKTAEERSKTEIEQTARQRAEAEKLQAEVSSEFWKLANAAKEARPEVFKVDDGDTEGETLLKQSAALVDLGMSLLPEERIADLPQQARERLVNGKLPPRELNKLYAAIHTMAVGFKPLERKFKAATAKIKELETALEGYKASEPGADNGKHPAEKKPMSFEDEIDALAR